MSEKITSKNIQSVIKRNKEIEEEITKCFLFVNQKYSSLQLNNVSNAYAILEKYGLIQCPIEDSYYSGFIFVRDDLRIPVINTALPRANQYFTAWHEVYHLLFDEMSFDHSIEKDPILEERKADYFASKMLMEHLFSYFCEISELYEFKEKIYFCMDLFKVPYKAVLISLYQSAQEYENEFLKEIILDNFDEPNTDIKDEFDRLGLDKSILLPSNNIRCSKLKESIEFKIKAEEDVNYHRINELYLKNILKDIGKE